MTLRPKATHFTTFEGGIWYAWVELTMPPRGIIHSVKFSDGSIWDSLIGWCEPTDDPSSKINLPRTRLYAPNGALFITDTAPSTGIPLCDVVVTSS